MNLDHPQSKTPKDMAEILHYREQGSSSHLGKPCTLAEAPLSNTLPRMAKQ